MSGTRRSRKQPELGAQSKKHRAKRAIPAAFISNRISALFGDSLAQAKKALLALGPAAALTAANFSPMMKPIKKTTAQKRAALVRKAEKKGIKLRTYKPKKKKGPR